MDTKRQSLTLEAADANLLVGVVVVARKKNAWKLLNHLDLSMRSTGNHEQFNQLCNSVKSNF